MMEKSGAGATGALPILQQKPTASERYARIRKVRGAASTDTCRCPTHSRAKLLDWRILMPKLGRCSPSSFSFGRQVSSMNVVAKVTLATILLVSSAHGSLAWTGNDVRNAGAIVVLGQRLTCRDEPAGTAIITNPSQKLLNRICSRTLRGSEVPGQVKNRSWRTSGGFTCESEVYRDAQGGPLIKLTCMKLVYAARSR